MSQKRNQQLNLAFETAMQSFSHEVESSSESDDEIEMLLMKSYLKYKSKRRRIRHVSSIRNNRLSSSDKEEDSIVQRNISPTSHIGTLNDEYVYSDEVDFVDNVTVAENVDFFPSYGDTQENKQPSPRPSRSHSPPNIPAKTPRKVISVASALTTRLAKLDNFVPVDILSSWTCSEDFRNSFRLSRTSVETMLRELVWRNPSKVGRPSVPMDAGILILLWILGTQESFDAVSKRFKRSVSTVYRTLHWFCQMLQSSEEYCITWPTGAEASRVAQEFEYTIPGVHEALPGTFGCLGTTHVTVAKKNYPDSYNNRFNYQSVALQAVCDSSGRFIDVSPGHRGSLTDAAVWRESPLSNRLETESSILPEGTHLLGHEAYPLTTRLMIPYRDDDALSPRQIKYNFVLNNKRALIENAFVKLKQRFHRVKCVDFRSVENVKAVLVAACICYNVALREGIDDGDEQCPGDAGINVGRYEEEDDNLEFEEEALIKRDNIAEVVYTNML